MYRRCYSNAQSKKWRKETKGKGGRKSKSQDGKEKNPWTFRKFDCPTNEINFVHCVTDYYTNLLCWLIFMGMKQKEKKNEKKR